MKVFRVKPDTAIPDSNEATVTADLELINSDTSSTQGDKLHASRRDLQRLLGLLGDESEGYDSTGADS